MEVFCRCGDNCIKSRSEVLKDYKEFYSACESCEDIRLKKFSPLTQQMDVNLLDVDFKRCVCGRRHLDVVMAHILKIMMDEGVKDGNSTLRNVCVPLITPSYPLDTVPYLLENSLVILSKDVDAECAKRIMKEVPEVKGVLKGNLRDIVGVKDSKSSPSTYELLEGCDLRCDIVNTPWGVLCIYKYQGQIHIEVPKPLSPKINQLKKVLSKYDRPNILDCTCGPGTLGLAALYAGARRVVFNDVWYPACETTVMNLEINGFPVTITGENQGLIATGENFEVYCLDLKDLKHVLNEKFDVCLVDVFPGVDATVFAESVEGICRKVVVI
ncbi:MAG TPA: methyltransferase [Methanobacterium sp.]